jgi:hypothetical protein
MIQVKDLDLEMTEVLDGDLGSIVGGGYPSTGLTSSGVFSGFNAITPTITSSDGFSVTGIAKNNTSDGKAGSYASLYAPSAFGVSLGYGGNNLILGQNYVGIHTSVTPNIGIDISKSQKTGVTIGASASYNW